jgi:hypothetical protein
MATATEHPFLVLGIAPTLDRQAIKRAYFAQLAKSPPHADPVAFRRLRTAYESLQSPQALQLAWLSAPIDTASALASWEARFGAQVEAARTLSHADLEPRAWVDQFIDWVTRLRLEDTRL